MQNYYTTVEEALGGFDNTIVPKEAEEQGKSQLLRRAGYLIHLKDPNIGYLSKPDGNQVHGLSVDVLMDKRDGSWADCASSEMVRGNDAVRRITAPWTPHGPDQSPSWLARWVKPTHEMALRPGPMPGGVEVPQDSEGQQEVHRYDGGGNDTGTCDICGKPRADPIHAIPESKVRHAYDGGEQDTGVCDICGNPPAHVLHQLEAPEEPGDGGQEGDLEEGPILEELLVLLKAQHEELLDEIKGLRRDLSDVGSELTRLLPSILPLIFKKDEDGE
jgi:hypothetical protein